MNEVVKYNNEMNEIKFKNFTPTELNLLMTICSKMKEKDLEIIEFSFEKLRELSNYDPNYSTKRFIKDLEKTYKKLINLDFRIATEDKIIGFVLFSKYEIDLNKKNVKIGVNPDFKFIFNDFTKLYTRFELQEFLDIKSKYSKECYRRLKQFRRTGLWTVEINEFRRILGVPESYEMKDLTKRVLKPIQEELSPIFKNLQIEKIKKKGAYSGRGNKVTHIVFTFEKEDEVPFNVRVNGNKSKLSSSERDIWKDLEIEKRQELDGQLEFTENIINWNK